MSDFNLNEAPEIIKDKKPAKKLEKGIKRVLIIAAIIFVAQFLWLFGITPFIPFSVIEVHEIEGLTRAEILALCSITEGSSYISTNIKNVQRTLSNHILVETAVVIKRFPDRLSVFLVPREAVAAIIANMGQMQVPVYIDRYGIFFKTADVNERIDLPIISGIENPRVNMKLPDTLVPLAENLGKLASTSPELLYVISEIRIERKVWDGYELVIFPVHSQIRVRIENNLTEEVLRYMLLVLNVLEAENQKPREIDFRSGMGSYSFRDQYL